MKNKKISKKLILYCVYVCNENYDLLNMFVFTPAELSSYFKSTIDYKYNYIVKRKEVVINV